MLMLIQATRNHYIIEATYLVGVSSSALGGILVPEVGR